MSLPDPNDAIVSYTLPPMIQEYYISPNSHYYYYCENHLNLTLATWSKRDQIRKNQKDDPQLLSEKDDMFSTFKNMRSWSKKKHEVLKCNLDLLGVIQAKYKCFYLVFPIVVCKCI